MRILVLGGDGYLGWPTALHLSACGHDVAVADNFARRGYDHELGVDSLVPIETLQTRVAVWREHTGQDIRTYIGDLVDASFTYHIVEDFQPDAVVHFAEQFVCSVRLTDEAAVIGNFRLSGPYLTEVMTNRMLGQRA